MPTKYVSARKRHPDFAGLLHTVLPGLVWLALFPLWQGGTYSHITKDKWIGFLILTAVTLVLVAAGKIIGVIRKKERFFLSPMQLLAVCYFAFLGISALFGTWHTQVNSEGELAVWAGSGRHEGMSTQLCYLAVFLLMSLQKPSLRSVVNGAAATLIVYTGIVCLQYFGVNVLGLYPAGHSILTNYEFQGTIGNIDMVSGYLSLVIPLTMCGRLLGGKNPERPLLTAAACCGTLLLLCTGVQSGLVVLLLIAAALVCLALLTAQYRADALMLLACMAACVFLRKLILFPWLDGSEALCLRAPSAAALIALAAAIAFGLLSTVSRKRGWVWRMKPLLLILIALAGILIAVWLLYSLPVTESSGTLWELHEILKGRVSTDFGNYRVGVWQKTLALISENMPLGTGPDTFLYAMKDYLARTGQTLPMSFDAPHNEYLAILSNGGIFSLLCYLALLACTIIAAVRRGGVNAKILLAAAVCFMVQGFFSFSICLISPMYWAVMGMIAGACGKGRKREKGSKGAKG